MNASHDPGRIMQTATAFRASKVLLTAVELDLFTTLGDGTMTAPNSETPWDCIPAGRTTSSTRS